MRRGSVRAIIALILVIGVLPVAIWAPNDGQTFYAAITGSVLTHYFNARASQNRQDGPVVGSPAFNGDRD